MMIIIIIQNKLKFTRSEKNKKHTPEAENLPIQSSESKLNPLSCWKGIFVICNFQDIFKKPERGENYTILQAIFSIDMLILFISTTCGVGGALAGIDNLGQISDSLGYKKHSIATFISLLSIWNFLGRILSGFASEIVLTKYNFPRTLFLTLFILLSCVGHALIAFGLPNSLYFSSIILGFCLGAQLSLASTIISEMFGLKHFSTLYSVGSVSSPIGSYIFNVKVAGQLYDKEALKQMESLGIKRDIDKELRCDGVHCFRMAFVVITVATFFGFLVSIILVLRTRKFYRKFREGVNSFEEIEPKNPVS
ncbi:uncharacterized protein LOC126677946 [Mercurialis annua]|uniref:uncharacterized protein LOC126677946 n=1 Tax=Mercurialis annua TaxID=3986 RepID=UPI00215F9D6D|nr:uncharacterized protein LOC126677946 [Mercurialis annua]XP_055961618.1 uncharacterized protein LOC126677946 [Mercurialis annua]XP_055961619.1 uncharacterized protein LOC126677946 [Mercurialis annua]